MKNNGERSENQNKGHGFLNLGVDAPTLNPGNLKLEQVMDSLIDGILAVDNEGKILAANHVFFNLWGVPAEIVEKKFNQALKKFMAKRLKAPRIFMDKTKTLEGSQKKVEEIAHFKDGRSIEWYSTPIMHGEESSGRVYIFRDVTGRIRFEKQLKEMSLRDKLTGVYNRSFFEEEINRLDHSREYPISIISMDLDGLKMINDTMGHDCGDKMLIAYAELVKDTLRLSDFLSRVGGDELIAILPRTDLEKGEKIANRIRARVQRYNRDEKNLPLSISLGVATATNETQSLMEVLQDADSLMYRDKLHRSSKARSLIVEKLKSELEEKDFFKQGHGSRLREWGQKVGEKAGLSLRQLENLELLSWTHDLGKTCISDRVLFKVDPLTKAERDIIQQHSEKGYRIALYDPELSKIANLILKHHENWDGTGYPLGLREEQIPIECRVISILDSYDAMTNLRCYRKPLSREDASGELKKASGTRYDPQLVDIFLSILEKTG